MELSDLQNDPCRWTDIAAMLGASAITIPHLKRGEKRPQNRDEWLRLGDAIAEVADRVTGEGLRIDWANHDHEYRRLQSGERPIDLILANGNVDYELVLGWLVVAGEDVQAELKRHAKRIRILRIRDWDRKSGTWPRSAAATLVMNACGPQSKACRSCPS